MLAPKKYEAIIEILIDQKPMAPTMPSNPIEAEFSDLIDFGRSRTLATQVQQIVSLGVIQTAAKKVAEQHNLPDPSNDPNSDLFPQSLQNSIIVSAEQQSDIISVR